MYLTSLDLLGTLLQPVEGLLVVVEVVVEVGGLQRELETLGGRGGRRVGLLQHPVAIEVAIDKRVLDIVDLPFGCDLAVDVAAVLQIGDGVGL